MFDVDFVEWVQHLAVMQLCLSFRHRVEVLDVALEIYAIVEDFAVEFVDATNPKEKW